MEFWPANGTHCHGCGIEEKSSVFFAVTTRRRVARTLQLLPDYTMKQSQPDGPRLVRDTEPLDLRPSHIAPKRAQVEAWYEDFSGEFSTPRTLGDTLRGVRRRAQASDLTLLAGGVAFFCFLALIPMLAAAVSLWALVSDPVVIESHFATLEVLLPARAYDVISGQLAQIAGGDSRSLSWGFGISLVLTLWSAKKGIDALMRASNAVYGIKTKRGFWSRTALAIVLTLGAVLTFVVLVALSIVVPAAVGLFGSDPQLHLGALWLRWPLMLGVMLAALGALYKAAPQCKLRYRMLSPGGVFATLAWLAASFGFSVYVENFGRYNETFGALGGVAILLVWFWLSSIVVLLGAAINAETHALAPKTPSMFS